MTTLTKIRKNFKTQRRYLKRKLHTFPIWYDEPDFIFIHINKTGGSSIEKALKLPFEHLTAQEKIKEVGIEKWQNKFTFSFVRNPYDKVCSHYRYRVKTNQTKLRDKPLSFSEWVQRSYQEHDPYYYDYPKMFMPQSRWLSDNSGNILVDKIHHFEQLNEDFNHLCKRMSIDAQLPHLKASKRVDYRSYYDCTTKNIVESCFAEDFNNFNYEF